jgi:hypothetical protein
MNIVEPGRPQMTIWRMRIAWWIPKVTNTHSGCAIRIAFPLQQLHELASMLRYAFIDCVVATQDVAQPQHNISQYNLRVKSGKISHASNPLLRTTWLDDIMMKMIMIIIFLA